MNVKNIMIWVVIVLINQGVLLLQDFGKYHETSIFLFQVFSEEIEENLKKF